MRDYRLQKLIITNFKGITGFTYNFDKESVNIKGSNGAGKTTIIDAVCWLFFGTDSLERQPADFDIKTEDTNGEVIPGLEHSVEGVFGETTLKKVYKETHNRAGELKGHKIEYFFNGEPVTKTDYEERLTANVTSEQIKMMMLPLYFVLGADKDTKRKVLFEMAEKVTDEHVIVINPELERYPDIVKKRSDEGTLKVIRSDRKKTRDRLDELKIRIETLNEQITQVNVDEAKSAITVLTKTLEKHKEKLKDITENDSVVAYRNKYREVENKKQERITELRKQKNQRINQAEKDLQEHRDNVFIENKKVQGTKDELATLKRKKETATTNYQALSKSIKDLQDKKEDHENQKPPSMDGEVICPTCNQKWVKNTKEQIQEKIALWKESRAETLKKIQAEIASYSDDLMVVEKRIDGLSEKIKKAEQQLEKDEKALALAKSVLYEEQSAIGDIETSGANYTDDEQIRAYEREQQQLMEKINSSEKNVDELTEPLQQQIKVITEKIDQQKEVIYKNQANKDIQEKINQYQQEQKQLAARLEQLDMDEAVVEKFIKARAELMSERVNSLFVNVTWKLFDQQLNGIIVPDCQGFYKNRRIEGGLNYAGQVLAGLEVVHVLKQHYKAMYPCLLDHRESVLDIPDTGTQLISLQATKDTPVLEITPKQ